ncbi:hypothetical protein HOV00_gp22 [Microbacterium phage Schubert]|uniref:Minor tail protein n=1 Tax=Microbacterium phage Schubert TaxID=2500787 RepID=A0A3T0INY7_9CAUD|nr:hypothetical protein HOV00_gp22 [Microbacterium phage Schubert]AZV01729.1 hypothetical protein SEA_SCHUBERT_22 [Microbacterium phage Schubert]
MATLETPPTPEYGPSTFSDLAELARILKDNDDALNQDIENISGGGGVTISKAPVTLASGYSNNSAYEALAAVKIGTLATLESGVINCPPSFSSVTYYTIGTLPTGFRPTNGKHRMGFAGVYSGTGIFPVQFRVNQDGTLNFLCPVAISGANYLVVPALTWEVAS